MVTLHRLYPPDAGAAVDLDAAYANQGARSVRANMVTTVDGAASGGDGLSGSVSGEADKRVFGALRRLADVVLVGAGTARAEGYRPARLPIAVVSGRLDLDLSTPLYTAAEHRTLVITCAAAPAQRREAVAATADVLVCGDERVDLGAAVSALHDRGLGHVLCEGGPTLLRSVAAAGLLDELCLTVSPYLVGGGAGRILGGDALGPAVRLHLLHLLEDEGFLFARYQVER